MAFRIYPPIGFARVGNDLDAFFVGPEIPGHPGMEIDAQGNETTVAHYKTANNRIKRQAARFRLFEVAADGGASEAQLPAGAIVEWSVHLVNKKAAVVGPGAPPPNPQRPQLVPNPAPLMIDPGARKIAGANAHGVKFDTGKYQNRAVPLGELRTDGRQNLLVLGGFGFSSSPSGAGIDEFYTNKGWHDDVADGPVKARIRLADGTTIDDIAPAWAIVGPPDFAPDIATIVTLRDIMLQVAVDALGLPAPLNVSFTADVFPILFRARRLQWVHNAAEWPDISSQWAALADASAAGAALRLTTADKVRDGIASLSRFRLTKRQDFVLNQWITGDFHSDWSGLPQPGAAITAEGLTRAALDGTVGQGFFPGIEAGIIVKDPAIYLQPFDFRIDHAQLKPGDMTALMALPWQADFWDCADVWWPSQRPDEVRLKADSPARAQWHRGAEGYEEMVANFQKLAFITAQKDAGGNVVFAEDQRADEPAFA